MRRTTKAETSSKNPHKQSTASAQPQRGRKVQRYAWLVAGLLLLSVGLGLGGWRMLTMWWYESHHTQVVALPSTPPLDSNAPIIAGKPTHIAIPSVSIDLEIIPGYYNATNESWTLTLDKAQWGAITSQPNNKAGMTYIYAHDRKHVFYDLPNIKPGDKAIVTTANHHTFTYTYKSNTIVSPSDTSLFNYRGRPILVLQTCTGLWYQYRQLFVFDLTSVQ